MLGHVEYYTKAHLLVVFRHDIHFQSQLVICQKNFLRSLILTRMDTTTGLLRRLRYVAPLVSVVSFISLTRLHTFGNGFSIEEDTMVTGRTAPFIHRHDLIPPIDHMELAFSRYGLPVREINSSVCMMHVATIEAKREDARDSLVYVFLYDGSRDQGSTASAGLSVGISLGKVLPKMTWLSKDITLVFAPKSAWGTDECDSLLISSLSGIDTADHLARKLTRGAVVVDLTTMDLHNGLELVVEGAGGTLTNQDFSNVLLESAQELGIPVHVKSVYQSILFTGMNVGARYLHARFHALGIPSFTLRSAPVNPQGGIHILEVAQLVGKHIRAASGLHHQLHHSTNWYFYSGPTQDVSLGVFLPLLLGIISPLFLSILDPDENNEPTSVAVGMLGLTLSAPLLSVMISHCISTVADKSGFSGMSRVSIIIAIYVFAALGHLRVLYWFRRYWETLVSENKFRGTLYYIRAPEYPSF
jgi:hypothetical protein